MEFISQGMEFFRQGGIVMYFLLAASIFVVFIGIERAFYFARADAGRAFAQEFMLDIANERFKEAVQLTNERRGSIADIQCDLKEQQELAQDVLLHGDPVRHRTLEDA